ncbi:unnamed protein product [Plutella xylostella]|uniref:(diamondback moth) hypothetical protein n=1 Tax=Plutella xylostella TaxID=51655 RepID=A0A8S4FMI6_PLUXY|nr:unnamed protein product [Plutella xylostella]
MAFSMIRPPADHEVALRLSPDLYRGATQFVVPEPTIYSSDIDPSYAERVMKIIEDSKMTHHWTETDTPQCSCTDVRQECTYSEPPGAPPAMVVLPNVTTANEWLVATQEQYIQKRYAGYSAALTNNQTIFTAWYNNKGAHALPAALAGVSGARMRGAGGAGAAIETSSHPLQISQEQLSRSTLLQHVADAGIAGMLLLAYSLIPAGAAIYLVRERTRREQRLQLLCGTSPAVYWASAALWDQLIIVLNICITACVLLLFGFPVFVWRDNLAAICLLLFMFGLACNALIHVSQRLFSDASLANMVLFCGNAFLGLSGLAILLILDIISESEATDNARWTLHKIFLLSPQFALGDALVEIAKNTIQATVLARFGMDTYASPLWDPLLSYHFTALALLTIVLTAFNLALEYDCFEGIISRFRPPYSPPPGPLSAAAAAERSRVARLNVARPSGVRTIQNINAGFEPDEKLSKPPPSDGDDVAYCVGLARVYNADDRPALADLTLGIPKGQHEKLSKPPPSAGDDVAYCVGLARVYNADDRPALADLTLGIPNGQCTALLGENGAGKSTTFSLLTGEIRASAGQIYLHGRPVTPRDLCSGVISYCPQSDALDPLLTVYQTLRFYCKLRGITNEREVIPRTIDMFSLSKYTHALAGVLSGGNKRKLSAAVAFMGRAPLVLLDEPTRHSLTTDTASLQTQPPYRHSLTTDTASLQTQPPYRHSLPTDTASLQTQPPYRHSLPTDTASLQTQPPYRHSLPTDTASLQTQPPYRHSLPTDTASLQTQPPYRHSLPTDTASLQTQPPYRHSLPTDTASLQTQPHYRHSLTTDTASLQTQPHYRHSLPTDTVDMFSLCKYTHALAGVLSGGNKRKLSAAVAFMGRAPLVLLDEPTSGMDPGSRALVTRVIRLSSSWGRSVLLSTHALQDAGRVAARAAVLRRGRLEALLDVATELNAGYVVTMRSRDAAAAGRALRDRIPRARVDGARVHLPATSMVDGKEVPSRLSDVLLAVAQLQAAGIVDDYTLNQTQLEETFLNFTDRKDRATEHADPSPRPSPLMMRRNSEELSSVTSL